MTLHGLGRTECSGLVEVEGERFYRIADLDSIPPFLMSLVSDGDRWMFVSSSGALTAGRRDANHALFPYVTDDRLHSAGGRSGPVARLRVVADQCEVLWRPFTGSAQPGVLRSLSKSVVGDSVMFEERHVDLGLVFRYRWGSSADFGFVRVASVENVGSRSAEVVVLDGLVDLMPSGLEPTLSDRLGNLTNAYKRNEVIDVGTGLAVYSLEAPVSDRAEPEEVLRATVAWSLGLNGPVSLEAGSVGAFEQGVDMAATLVTGVPGSHLTAGAFGVEPGAIRTWYTVADVGYDQSDVVALRQILRDDGDLAERLDAGTRRTAHQLRRIMSLADALQCTGDNVAAAHHFSNVTYNVMRGGVPLDGYVIGATDFTGFVERRNGVVAERHAEWLAALPAAVSRSDLASQCATRAAATGDVHLARLADEFVPFSFSRRHGDPSRPWNQFSIRVREDDGQQVVYYEGNWRDVFQNWEALCDSFPQFLPGVVSIFVNASTADGHNPYRITSEGIDWEVPDDDDPWGNIGYWGDHQIVYLLRLLKATEQYLPGEIGRRLTLAQHTYADVPYRIATYDRLLSNPKDTIRFDDEAAGKIDERVRRIGGDGKLLVDADDDIVVVTLLEKLLVTALAKLSNFVPGGGIWMNTQRPEWNDANNALVGFGLSMVTLYHLRRYLSHLRDLITETQVDTTISAEVATWLLTVTDVLRAPASAVDGTDAARDRRAVMDGLGSAASMYRTTLYESGLSGTCVAVQGASIVELIDHALRHIDVTIDHGHRPDGLMHSYNLVDVSTDQAATVTHLHEMLEGQVAALSCGRLTAGQQADLLDALFASPLYRPDQDSFLLAPMRRPPAFLDKNVIGAHHLDDNSLLRTLVDENERSLIRRDAEGNLRFAPALTTSEALRRRLDLLGNDRHWATLVEQHRRATLDTYEDVFGHRSYLGRSGSMYAYEGIGSIYWHMVSKLLLAVQEAASDAEANESPAGDVARLVDAYWRVRGGLGFNKTAEEFGAVPIDPYSHTPAHAGAQQPGMTGAVKEEILTRRRELGVRVDDGEVVFDSLLLRNAEMLEQATTWMTLSTDAREVRVELAAGTLGMTLCQIPVVVDPSTEAAAIDITYADGTTERRPGLRLGRNASSMVFARTGEIERIRVVGIKLR